MAKKHAKKSPKASKLSAKKASKKPASKKTSKQASARKKPKAKAPAKAKPAPKAVKAGKAPAGTGKKRVQAAKPVTPTKAAQVQPPPQAEQKPKGAPTKLSMILEEKETQPVITRPRITRSKSGNLLFQLEYTIRSSPTILYEFITTPSGLAQWFADKVDINDHHCVFEWEGVAETATIIDSIPDEYIRYRWDSSDEDEYFEFRISKNEITGDTILTITDFASENAMKDQKMLWDSQVKTLIQQIGG